jgi:hypothetical protein
LKLAFRRAIILTVGQTITEIERFVAGSESTHLAPTFSILGSMTYEVDS